MQLTSRFILGSKEKLSRIAERVGDRGKVNGIDLSRAPYKVRTGQAKWMKFDFCAQGLENGFPLLGDNKNKQSSHWPRAGDRKTQRKTG